MSERLLGRFRYRGISCENGFYEGAYMENFENDNYNRDPNVKNDEASTQNETPAPQDTPADKNENSNEYFVHKSSGAIPPAANKGSRTKTAAADGIFADNTQKNARALGIASMTLGILSVCLCCCLHFITLAVAITGLVLGIISQKKSGNGFAIAGIITSAFGIVFGLVGVVLLLVPTDNDWWDFINSSSPGNDRPGYDPNTDASIGEKLFSFVRALKFFFI